MARRGPRPSRSGVVAPVHSFPTHTSFAPAGSMLPIPAPHRTVAGAPKGWHEPTGGATTPSRPRLPRLLLFYIVTTFSLRWIATAAAAGPSALVIWVIAAVGLFVPLVFTVLELSSRYPEEGGMYIWSKRAFGPFAGVHDRLVVLGHEPAVFPGTAVFRGRQRAVHRRTVVADAGRRAAPTSSSSRSPDWRWR